MKTHYYKHLSLQTREQIALFKASGKSMRSIAKRLRLHHSTVSRELKRNQVLFLGKHSYLPSRAHLKAFKRKSASATRPRLKSALIRKYVARKIKSFWSPELISGRMALDHPGFSISHEAIYQFIYAHAWNLIPYLPRKHKRRRLKIKSGNSNHSIIPNRNFIHLRPEIINSRSQFGHWEADSIVSSASRSSIHVLLERKSRFCKLSKISQNSARFVSSAILSKLAFSHHRSRRSITYDNGSENTSHLLINQKLKTQSFF